MTKQDELDRKTPKSKFKSVMRKFENEEIEVSMKNERKEIMKNEKKFKCERKVKEEKENAKNTDGTSLKTFNTLGESWKGTHWATLTPSSVRSPEKSAEKRAHNGQLFDIFRRSNMYKHEMGKEEKFKGKRKLISSEENKLIEETLSPKKLPKLNISKTLFFSRLGGSPGKGTQQDSMMDKGEHF